MTDHTHTNQPVQQAPPQDTGAGWTGYALVKYGFIFLIVLAILWFLGNYVLGIFD
jgi:hypothetical protein